MSVFIHCQLPRTRIRRRTLCRVTLALLERLGRPDADVGIGFIGDTRMRRLNKTYRGQDRTTDVLAFAYREVPIGPRHLLGDVVIAMPMARRQAVAAKHSPDEEVLRLLIHGVLHVFGYDHEQGERQARLMRRKEAELLATLAPLPRVVVTAAPPPRPPARGRPARRPPTGYRRAAKRGFRRRRRRRMDDPT